MRTFPQGVRAEGRQLADLFARSVAASFPVTSASASVFHYGLRGEPAPSVPLLPVFGERAQTLGHRNLSLALNYQFLDFATINGKDLNKLVSADPRTSDSALHLARDDFAEPVQMMLDLDVEAQIIALNATYGLTPEIDVNVFLPLVRTFLRSQTTFTAPDPRAPPDPRFFRVSDSLRETDIDVGIGDLVLRGKYWLRAFRTPLDLDLALGLTVSVPTGSSARFHGVGDTQVGSAVYLSHPFGEWGEANLNLGIVANADALRRSYLRYSLSTDTRLPFFPLTLQLEFLGRSEVADPDSSTRTTFTEFDRSDFFDLAIGLRWLLPGREPFLLTANALLPLNRDGARTDVTFTGGVSMLLGTSRFFQPLNDPARAAH